MEARFNAVGVNSGRAFLFRNRVVMAQSRVVMSNWDGELNPTRYRPNSDWVYSNVKTIDRHITDCRLAILNNTPGMWHVPHEPGSYNARRLLWMHDTLYALRRYRTFCSRFAAQMKRTISRESSEGDFYLAQMIDFL